MDKCNFCKRMVNDGVCSDDAVICTRCIKEANAQITALELERLEFPQETKKWNKVAKSVGWEVLDGGSYW